MGNPRKPTHLKEVQGTKKQNPHRVNNSEPVPLKGIGEPPSFFNSEEKGLWDEIVGNTCPGVLGNSDRIALEMICKLLKEFRYNYEDFSAAKMARLQSLLSLFGMTPSDRTKIVVPKQEEENPFQGM